MKKNVFLAVFVFIGILLIIFVALSSPRMSGSELDAIGSLKTISTAQTLFQMEKIVNQDGDNMGEFGFLPELAGLVIPRGLDTKVIPCISSELGNIKNGIAFKKDYYFCIYLPSTNVVNEKDGKEQKISGIDKEIIDKQEKYFICYAWPKGNAKKDDKIFVVNQRGQVFFSFHKGDYSDSVKPPVNAAFPLKGKDWEMPEDESYLGQNEQKWVPLN